jgi:protein TonB
MRNGTTARTLATLVLLGVLQTSAQLFSGQMAGNREGATMTPPRKIQDVAPVYPPIAQSARVQGSVVIEATIGTDGHVQDARVLRSIPLLDAAALDAVRQWEFSPALFNGVPVPVIMTITVRFSLADDRPGLDSAPSPGSSRENPIRHALSLHPLVASAGPSTY